LRRGLVFALGLMLAVVLGGCGVKPDRRAALPLRGEGWQRSGEVELVGPERLFDHINGGAEIYLEKGFRELVVGYYVLSGGVEASVEAYMMENPAVAAEMFSLEQGSGATQILGEEASVAAQSIAFRKGAYYVKLLAYSSGGQVRDHLSSLGKAVEEGLPEG
jgi:hypothetical protein